VPPEAVQDALDAVETLCNSNEIPAPEDFLESCRAFAQEKMLNVAVLGRFKAGKSSFLNHLLGRPLLPVGVILPTPPWNGCPMWGRLWSRSGWTRRFRGTTSS
jgi:ribosome biogenesis GTPase A